MRARAVTIAILIPAFSVFGALPAYAYIGPGAGAGTIAVVLGILSSIVMAFFAILWYPVKRIIKKFRPAKRASAKSAPEMTEGLTKS